MSTPNPTPLPRRTLGPGLTALLWAMRLYALLAVPLVIYAFIKALQHSH